MQTLTKRLAVVGIIGLLVRLGVSWIVSYRMELCTLGRRGGGRRKGGFLNDLCVFNCLQPARLWWLSNNVASLSSVRNVTTLLT